MSRRLIFRRSAHLAGRSNSAPCFVFPPQRAHAARARLVHWLQSITADAQRTDGEGPALSRRRMAVERVRRFIHEHLAETMTLAELCQHAHLQARSLEYGFRDLVGLSPFKYIKMLRLGRGPAPIADDQCRGTQRLGAGAGLWLLPLEPVCRGLQTGVSREPLGDSTRRRPSRIGRTLPATIPAPPRSRLADQRLRSAARLAAAGEFSFARHRRWRFAPPSRQSFRGHLAEQHAIVVTELAHVREAPASRRTADRSSPLPGTCRSWRTRHNRRLRT